SPALHSFPTRRSSDLLTLVGIVLAGVLGNLVGSWIAYGVGRAGRLELVERHGRWLHLQPRHIAWADRWFARYGSAAVFFSRMLRSEEHTSELQSRENL